MTTMDKRAVHVMRRIDTLASFSESPTKLTRAYLTPEHSAVNEQLASWMQQVGMETWVDSVGNQWGRKVSPNPTEPTLILGSHSDTVINAGKYDGNLGVVLAIETLANLSDETFPFHIDVVAFADEEGTRFNTTLIGSSAISGCFKQEWLEITDADGVTMAQAMREFGLDPMKAGSDARLARDTLSYLEVHIEQGPVLEAADLAVGVVTGIAGAMRFRCKVKGVAGHAGTVPLGLRNDALCGVAEMISYIEDYAHQNNIVATVGKCDVLSAAVNVIPGEVTFTIDIRSSSQPKLDACSETLLKKIEQIASQRSLSFYSEKFYQAPAVLCSEVLQQKWASAVETVTCSPPLFLASGAGHDAMVVANITDIGMLFVRCNKGISHNPRERVTNNDVEIALSCFIEMVRRFKSEPIKK